jgi:hypothetical protein
MLLDDILIPSRSVDETMSILRRVLVIFRANGLTFISFLQTSIEYLGLKLVGPKFHQLLTK